MRSDVHIAVVKERGVTVLRKAFCTQPFKAMDVSEDRTGKCLKIMLMSSSPGILDGDVYNLEIRLAQSTSLELLTQSYQRLFSMKQGASQNISVHLENNAWFRFLPHPIVPHEAADFTSNAKIYLAEGCTVVWGEVLTCGRKLNGEVFRFSRYHAITEIFMGGKLVIKENILLQPATCNLNSIGQLEGFTHQATLIFLNEFVPVKELINVTIAFLEGELGIIFGVTTAPVNGVIVRMLGNKAEQLHNCVRALAGLLECRAQTYKVCV